MDEKTRSIIGQVAYKCASWIHAAEVQTGASPDFDYLHEMARKIANGIIKIGGVHTAVSPASGGGGGGTTVPSHETAPSSLPCPRCDAPMDLNNNWTGLGDYEGHKASESIKWRCSQRGRFVKGQGWEGCDGARWEDLKVEGLPHKAKSA